MSPNQLGLEPARDCRRRHLDARMAASDSVIPASSRSMSAFGACRVYPRQPGGQPLGSSRSAICSTGGTRGVDSHLTRRGEGTRRRPPPHRPPRSPAGGHLFAGRGRADSSSLRSSPSARRGQPASAALVQRRDAARGSTSPVGQHLNLNQPW